MNGMWLPIDKAIVLVLLYALIYGIGYMKGHMNGKQEERSNSDQYEAPTIIREW